jgi:hypothetical protein
VLGGLTMICPLDKQLGWAILWPMGRLGCPGRGAQDRDCYVAPVRKEAVLY